MKVNIGPYPKHYSVRKFEDSWFRNRYGKEAYDIAESEKDAIDYAVEWTCDSIQWILSRTVNRFFGWLGRKEKIKLHHYDSWNADHTLALIIVPLLKQLRDKSQSYAMVDFKDVPKNLRPSKEENEHLEKTGEMDSNGEARWHYVLNEMIFAFECLADDSWEDQFFTGNTEILWTPVDVNSNEVSDDYDGIKYYRMDRGPNDTSHFDKKGFDKYNKRINNGLKLFGKYYRALWD
jgi:hypothetical protein